VSIRALAGDTWQSLAARAYRSLGDARSPLTSAGRYWFAFIDYNPELDPLEPPQGGRLYVGPPPSLLASTYGD
jgi:hypothetical protein